VSWDTLTWRQAGADDPEGVGPILTDVELLKSALEEAVSTHLMAPVTVTALEVANVADASALPDGFLAVGTFEAVGHEPCAVAVALDPDGGDHLAGSTFDVVELGWKLAVAIDQAVETIAGEGLQAAMSTDAALPAAEPLVVLRLTLADADGGSVRLAAAMTAEAPAYVGTHVPTVRALSQISLDVPASGGSAAAGGPVAPGSSVQAPAAAPAAQPGAVPGYPEIGGTTGYPQAAAGYPQAPAGYPPAAAYPQPALGTQPGVRPLSLEELRGGPVAGPGGAMDLLYGVNLEVTVEIGRTRLSIREVLALTPGSIVELDKIAGEKVDVLVNGHLIASGEVVVVEDNFGVRITDVSARARRLAMGEGAA
jgi:flagellar motor switch protein FliN